MVNISRDYYNNWFKGAERFFEDFEHNLIKGENDKGYYKNAIFNLHQATEYLFTTIALVHTHYKHKSHELQKLYKNIVVNDERFKAVFPLSTDEEKRLFKILHKAYIDSRYKMNYSVTKEDLEYIGQRVKLLRDLTKEVCEEKIEKMKTQ